MSSTSLWEDASLQNQPTMKFDLERSNDDINNNNNNNNNPSTSGGGRVFVSTPASKFPKKLVKDCMVTPVPYVVTPSTSIDEAMSLFLRHGITGAPVVQYDDDNDNENHFPTLVGMVSTFDFLPREAFEGSLLPMDMTDRQETVKAYVQAAQRICGQTVQDVMTPISSSSSLSTQGIRSFCYPETPMRQAAAVMTQQKLDQLPVVIVADETQENETDNDYNNNNLNHDLRLVGMLTAEHVLQDLLHLVRLLPAATEANINNNNNANASKDDDGNDDDDDNIDHLAP